MTTRTSERIVFTIIEYHKENGYAPSWEEIRQAVGLKSKATVSYHMRKLRDSGRISYLDGQPRTLVVTDRSAGHDTSG